MPPATLRDPRGFWAVFAALGLILAGCAGHLPYETLDAHLSSGDCAAAQTLLAEHESDYNDNAALLYLLDSAMVHMHCRQFRKAQENFRAAEDLAERLWTLSLSREMATYVTNDYVQAYGGEDFERAMIHLMSALAFLDEGRPDEALVECRRLDSLLTLLNDKYQEKNVYREDAFGRYLSGMLREADHDPDGAFIDYKKAVSAYGTYEADYGVPLPADLKADLFRMAERTGRTDDARLVLPGYPGPPDPKDGLETGQVAWIELRGRVPEKEEDRIIIYTGHGPLTMAFPRYGRPAPPGPGRILTLTSEDGEIVTKTTALVSDISAIAVKNLEDRRARITAKAVARIAAKQVLIRKIARNDDKKVQRIVENLLNVMNLFLERADLRSWRSLPGRIYMTRLFLPPGSWEAVAGNGPGKIRKNLLVEAGQLHYIIVNDALGRAFP